jgi:hypothetical protein
MFCYDYDEYNDCHGKGIKRVLLRSMRNADWKNTDKLNLIEFSPKIDLFYSLKGRLVHLINHKAGKKTSFSYDKKGNIVSNLTLSKDENQFLQYTEIRYNENFEVIHEKRSHHYSADSIFYDVERVYTRSVNYCEIIDTSYEDEPRKFEMIFYSGNLVEQKILDGIDLKFWFKYSYDDLGNLICERSLDNEGKVISKTSYSYMNDLDYEIFVERFDSENENYTRKCQHYFNSKGHWIKQLVFTNNILHFVNNREIDYY